MRKILATVSILSALSGPALALPYSRLVVVFDNSGSVAENLDSAWGQVEKMIKRHRVVGPDDEVILIRLDSHPDILFDGRGDQVRKAREAFQGLSKVSGGRGTDVAGALELASYCLTKPGDNHQGEPKSRALLVLSDMIVDQPKDGRHFVTPEACQPSGLKGVEVECHYVPPAQDKLWRPVFERAGAKATFYLPARSRNVQIQAPERPFVAGSGGSFFFGLVKLAGLLVGLAVLAFVVLAGVARLLASRQQQPRQRRTRTRSRRNHGTTHPA